MNRWSIHFLLGSIAASMLIIAGCGDNRSDAPQTASSPTPAASPKATPASAGSLVVTEVVDTRVLKDPETGNPVIVGSIVGTGLQEGDTVVINKISTFGTVFGNDTWITYQMPISVVGKQNSFTLQVVRPSTQEQSRPFTLTFKR